MVTRFRNLLTLSCKVRYVLWRAGGSRGEFQCHFKDGLQVAIRPSPSEDFATVYEIFCTGIYDTELPVQTVRRVVDVGGNIGYSCLFWCSHYPNASVITFEPIPSHLEILKRHLKRNACDLRVAIIPAAAASREGTAFFLEEDVRSRRVSDGGSSEKQTEVRLVDFFTAVGNEKIDVLKMDIEGGEYELMRDPRFEDVARRCRSIVMEWHQRDPDHLGGEWCIARLRALGFSVKEKLVAADIGILTAHNLDATTYLKAAAAR